MPDDTSTRTPPPARPKDGRPSPPANNGAARKARSAQALRDNLRRRKQQGAARRNPGPATEA